LPLWCGLQATKAAHAPRWRDAAAKNPLAGPKESQRNQHGFSLELLVVQGLSRNPKDLALFSCSGAAHPSQLLAACASETACAPQPPNSSDSLGSVAPQ
jgi:hypothetical protein